MSHKAKGLSRTSHWLSSFHWAGSFRLPCPSLLSSVPGPVAACRTTGASRPEGWCFPLLWPSWCQYPPAGSPLHPASTRYRDSTAMCSPLTRVTQYRPTTRNITANTSPHCQATGFTSSFLREISLKKGKIIKNQWNSNVRQSTVWTERGRQAFHHQQLPAKQLQTSLWNAP